MSRQKSKTESKKPKLVRDSFTIPKSEYAAVETLKSRTVALGASVKKSELLRAGLKLLTGLSDSAYLNALSAIPTLKTGRPRSEKPQTTAPLEGADTAASKPVSKPRVRTTSRSPAPRAVSRKAAPTKKSSAPHPVATPRKTAVRKKPAQPAATSA